MIRILDNHVVLRHDRPEQLRAVFPDIKEATIKGERFVAVPHTLESARIFNNLNIKVESPIRRHYEWPGRYKPKAHQVHTAEFLTLNPRAFCLNGMGSMKTISSLWAADYLQRLKVIKKVLVVAPLSTLEPTWGQEIFQNFPLKSYAILHGSRQKRKDLLAGDYDIYLINHDGVEIIADDLIARKDIDLFILDESAVYRNQQSNRWKVLNKIINKYRQVPNVWGMTGAPTPNDPTDAYGQVKLIKPENYKGHFTSFKHETMVQITQFKWVPKRGAEESVGRIMKPSIRYALQDCVDLPETVYSDRMVPLSQEQQKHYRELIRQAATEIKGTTVTAVNSAVLIGKIVQASLGVLYGADGTTVKIDSTPRTKLVKELIESCDQKVIVFVPFTAALQSVAAELRKRWTVEVVDGGTSMAQRNRIFREFRSLKDPHVLVANAGAMSHGLTLVEASMIIWYAPVTSNDTYVQANARIVRPGQKFVTNIVHVYATAEEKRIYAVLKERGKLQDLVLDLAKEN